MQYAPNEPCARGARKKTRNEEDITVAIDRMQIFKENLTTGLDLGDRTGHCCILNEEAGQSDCGGQTTNEAERN
jgi:hypothetical protein